MEALPTYTQPFFAWLLETTLVASVVIGLILVSQRFLGERLGPRWCHALWLVLLLRMVLPWTPPSPWSLRDLIPGSIPQAWPHASVHVTEQDNRSELGVVSEGTQPKAVSPSEPTAASPQTTVISGEALATRKAPPALTWPVVRRTLPLFWLAGAVVLGAYLVTSNIALWRLVKRERPLLNQPILELFEACKSQMGVQTIVAIVPSDRVTTAALFGFVRPRLLLPRDLIETASQEELRYIFLHELAHLKRRDIYLGWIASLLQVLHWFNPLVWLAFHKMRADRELACDALVLTRTGRDESRQYGRTIVGLLERFCRTRSLPAMAGILESRSQLKRRIAMIARFQNNSYRWSPTALVLVVALACISLTNARETGIAAGSADSHGADAHQVPLAAEDLISDPNSGLQFRKVCAIAGNKDVIEYTYDVAMSPDARFLSYGKYIIPLDGEDVRRFADLPAWRSSWSPDGTMVAFYSGGIWLVPVSPQTGKPTGPARKLVDDDVYWYHQRVEWSPDSKQFVYEGREGQLRVLSIGDGATTQITEGAAQRRVPGGWSPDGRWIVYWRGDNSIRLIGPEGGPSRKLVDVVRRVHPRFSPDGTWIFYPVGQRIQFVRVADAFRTDITVPWQVGAFVSWSPDGKRMLFYRPSFDWTGSLRVVPAAGGEPINPAWGMILSASDHRWSADGKAIFAWRTYQQENGYWIVPLSGPAPYPVRLPESVRGKLEQVSLSPKANRAMFSSELDQEALEYWAVSISPKTGDPVGKPVRVFDKGRVGNPVWSPDESRLALVCDGDLWIAETDGRPPVKFTRPSDKNVVRHAWSPDGGTISWVTHDPNANRSTLRVRRLSEDTPRDIVETTKYIHQVWSPSGAWLAYRLYERALGTTQELFVVAASGGESRRVIELAHDDYHAAFQYTWCPQGEKLVLLGGRRLLTFDPANGQQRQVGGLLDPMWGRCIAMECSPDGQTLALDMEARPRSSDHLDPDGRLFTVTLADGKWSEPAGKIRSGYSVGWSPDGKWLSFDCDESIKLRPAGVLWEVDVGSYLDRFTDNDASESRPSPSEDSPSNTIASAASAPRWTNSLGMPFVPVKGTSVRFCVWETRVKDFEAFVSDTGRDMGNKMTCFNGDLKHDEWEGYNWKNPGYAQGPDHPVVGVNWEDATAFCKWLTEKERKEGVLAARQVYRLPSDSEWSAAVGLKAVSGDAPEKQDRETTGAYPWGTQWPPTKGAGNYADMTARAKYGADEFKTIEGYDDGYAEAAPVGSFEPNPCGLYDMGGNVLEWCGYWVSSDTDEYRSLRGASWGQGDADSLHSRYRIGLPPARASSPGSRASCTGFRVVLEH